MKLLWIYNSAPSNMFYFKTHAPTLEKQRAFVLEAKEEQESAI